MNSTNDNRDATALDLDAIERCAEAAKSADDSPWVVKTNDARIAEYIRTMDPDTTLRLVAAAHERDAAEQSYAAIHGAFEEERGLLHGEIGRLRAMLAPVQEAAKAILDADPWESQAAGNNARGQREAALRAAALATIAEKGGAS